MGQIYNFSAGPAVLPGPVLERAQAELTDWNATGMSVMEMSHRGNAFMSIAEQAEADLRDLLAIPANYQVLFLQGGASSQFSMIPLNFSASGGRADYIDTGDWSAKAIAEGQRYVAVNVAASSQVTRYVDIPVFNSWQCDSEAAYLHYTPNETIRGVEFGWVPETGDVPLIADMSSTLLSRPIDVSRFGMIYAGAQKNIGPAGLTIVIIRDDLIGKARADTPTMFDYAVHAKNKSMYDTPPTYAWYMAGLVFKWLKALGGLEAIADINQRKAKKLYRAIDQSGFYNNPVDPACRSWMNIPFTLAEPTLDQSFLDEAATVGLSTLKGHRALGGMRASIYNAMPEAGVDALIEFMQDFENKV